MGLGGVDKILVVQLSVCQFWQETGRTGKLAERPVDSCLHALVAYGSVEHALSNNTCGARLLPATAKTARAPLYGGRASGPEERAMLQLWVMVS